MPGEGAAQIAVGDDSEEVGVGVDDASGAEGAAGHLDDDLAKWRAEGDGGEVAVHRLMDTQMEIAADLAGGVETGEIGMAELPDFSHGKS